MVIKETYDLKSFSNRRFGTEYIHNAKTSKSMYIAKILVLGLAVGGMLFTRTMAKTIFKNKIDTFAVVKKKESKKETHDFVQLNFSKKLLFSIFAACSRLVIGQVHFQNLNRVFRIPFGNKFPISLICRVLLLTTTKYKGYNNLTIFSYFEIGNNYL